LYLNFSILEQLGNTTGSVPLPTGTQIGIAYSSASIKQFQMVNFYKLPAGLICTNFYTNTKTLRRHKSGILICIQCKNYYLHRFVTPKRVSLWAFVGF